MRYRIPIAVLGLVYLGAMAWFAFRPFTPIRGVQYARADLGWADGAVILQRDAAIEIDCSVPDVRQALVDSGELSLEIILRTDRYDQPGTPIIAAFGQSCFNQNFSLTQDGNGIEFRLRTTSSDNYGLHPSFLVSRVVDPARMQHLVITYDGVVTRLYVDGLPRAATDEIHGGFENWGVNHAFTLGDEPPGGDAWFGSIRRYALYDRALSSEEVAALWEGRDVMALLAFDFSGKSGALPKGLKELRYRNLFITTDPAAYELSDCIFNIIGFIPLGMLAYMLLPVRLERRKFLAAIVIPVVTGLAASGTIEWVQRYVFMRVPCAPDLVYNTTGALIGGLMAWLAFSTFKNRTSDGSET